MRKGLFNNHTKDFENWLGKPGRGFHLQINARTEGDLDEAIVLDKLNKVSSFIKATTLKSAAQDKEQLKQQSSQYWQKEKQQDEERRNVMTSHAQAQQQTLAAAKDAEQKRLAQQAKSTLSSMEQQRAQNVQEYKVFTLLLDHKYNLFASLFSTIPLLYSRYDCNYFLFSYSVIFIPCMFIISK